MAHAAEYRIEWQPWGIRAGRPPVSGNRSCADTHSPQQDRLSSHWALPLGVIVTTDVLYVFINS